MGCWIVHGLESGRSALGQGVARDINGQDGAGEGRRVCGWGARRG